MGKSEEPVFVNLQTGVVQVFNEKRRPVRVAPWANRNRGQSAVFEVTGEHYRQFVSAKGPLFPRPRGAESAAPAPSTGPAASGDGAPDGSAPGEDAGGKKGKDAPPTDLSKYNVDGAVAAIAATDDMALLIAWANAEAEGADRKGVKEAIKARLEVLEQETS